MSASRHRDEILLVEDEESLAVGLEFNLREEGYSVTRADNGREALKLVEERRFDLIVLDLMLPFIDGFEVARSVRRQDPQIPILILTARSSPDDKIRGLEIGADDYMTKPFHLEEFVLRVRGMLKRKSWYRESVESDGHYASGKLEVDFERLEGRRGARSFELTPLEAALLRYLIQHEGRVVSKQELLEQVWGVSSGVETRTVDNFVMRLRKHIEETPARPRRIITVRGAGYRFLAHPGESGEDEEEPVEGVET